MIQPLRSKLALVARTLRGTRSDASEVSEAGTAHPVQANEFRKATTTKAPPRRSTVRLPPRLPRNG